MAGQGFYGTNLPGNEAEGDIASKGSVNSSAAFKDTLGGIIDPPAGTDTPLRSNGPELSRNH